MFYLNNIKYLNLSYNKPLSVFLIWYNIGNISLNTNLVIYLIYIQILIYQKPLSLNDNRLLATNNDHIFRLFQNDQD